MFASWLPHYRSSVPALVLSLTCTSAVGAQQANLNDISFQTEPEQRSQFDESSFIFPFAEVDSQNQGSNLRGLFVNTEPALATLPNDGVGQNLVTLAACAVNQPHVHPRGTEVSFVTEGSIFFGFLEENAAKSVGGRFLSGNVTQGESVIIPQGLTHFAHNKGCTQAQFIASFPTKDPGTQTIASSFFKLPLDTLQATLGIKEKVIAQIQAVVANTPNPSLDPDCLARCGFSTSSAGK